jgi:3-oxoacyl-[acyl-carrier protein] reductase
VDLGLSGKVALVCGASRGIGFAAAQHFAREGASVVLVARNAEALAHAAERLIPTGADVRTLAADLSTTEGIAHVVKSVPRVDVLVTNTGGPTPGPALSHDWAAWTTASNLLLRSAVELTRAYVPAMRERKWGRVIGITSMAVKQPVNSLVLSNAFRAAVTGYFRTLADEVAVDGVTVNTVLPGYTETERLEELAAATSARTGATRDSVYEGWKRITPAGRLGTPDELGAVVAFLASVPAGFITGQAILADGGAVRSLL